MQTTIRKVVHIRLYGWEVVLDTYAKKLVLSLSMIPGIGLHTRNVVPLPTFIRKWNILKSPFKHKRARHAFEMRTHKRLISFEADKELANRFVNYVIQLLPSEVGAKINVFTYEPLSKYYNMPPEFLQAKPRSQKANLDQMNKLD